ncbi:MAG: hypothetical protein KTR31_03735, partial [Myxococcales bacterium]|nr:hypothetical protein [Myxococcales bacterium]
QRGESPDYEGMATTQTVLGPFMAQPIDWPLLAGTTPVERLQFEVGRAGVWLGSCLADPNIGDGVDLFAPCDDAVMRLPFSTFSETEGRFNDWGGLWFTPAQSTCALARQHNRYELQEDGLLRIDTLQIYSRFYEPVRSELDCFGPEASQDFEGPWELYWATTILAEPER